MATATCRGWILQRPFFVTLASAYVNQSHTCLYPARFSKPQICAHVHGFACRPRGRRSRRDPKRSEASERSRRVTSENRFRGHKEGSVDESSSPPSPQAKKKRGRSDPVTTWLSRTIKLYHPLLLLSKTRRLTFPERACRLTFRKPKLQFDVPSIYRNLATWRLCPLFL